MKKIDVFWRLFQKCNRDIDERNLPIQFAEIFNYSGFEGLAKYIIQNIWVYSIGEDEDTMYLRYMMVSLWKNGQWPEDTE